MGPGCSRRPAGARFYPARCRYRDRMTKRSRAATARATDPAAVVARLTLDQKARLVSGASFWSTAEAPGVPPVYLADGPHGVRRLAPDVGGVDGALPATCFPPAVALGSTFDVDLVARVGQAVGAEARRRAVDVVLGPGVNIKRTPCAGATSSTSPRTRCSPARSVPPSSGGSSAPASARASSTSPRTTRRPSACASPPTSTNAPCARPTCAPSSAW
nr:hypothetical protein GCM10025730_34830 [Promicromonospora thailandica]